MHNVAITVMIVFLCYNMYVVFFQPAGTLNLPKPGTINFDNQVNQHYIHVHTMLYRVYRTK